MKNWGRRLKSRFWILIETNMFEHLSIFVLGLDLESQKNLARVASLFPGILGVEAPTAADLLHRELCILVTPENRNKIELLQSVVEQLEIPVHFSKLKATTSVASGLPQ